MRGKRGLPPNTVRVDRITPYGNPFKVGVDGNRDTVCNMFEDYARQRLQTEPHWLDPLKGKNLACWCYPKRCHAETLMRLANK